MNLEQSKDELSTLLTESNEWLLLYSNGKSFALRVEEIELSIEREKLLLGFLDDKGFQTLKITNWKHEKQRIYLNLTKNFGRETIKIELVPRIASAEFAESTELARIEKANQLAALIIADNKKAKLVRVSLSADNGRLADIIFEDLYGNQRLAIADVSDSLTPEFLLSSAILKLEKLQLRKKNPINIAWILAEKKQAKRLQKLFALVRKKWSGKTTGKEIVRDESEAKNLSLIDIEKLNLPDLWRKNSKKSHKKYDTGISESANRITEYAPDEIDVLKNRNSETLRFNGFPFARIRTLLGKEKVWFGTEKVNSFLSAQNYSEFIKLIDELKTYRKFDSLNNQHLFYKHAPEAWLESILRRNIKLLDANLILSPIHHQFRTEGEKIDLLALRRDGRLVIIELKTAPDREMVYQAADYWQKIETERRTGNLQAAKIFGDLEIKDEPALVYLVAPLLSYHRDFEFLAKTVIPEIEIYRFDANENWRESLKITRRERSNDE